MPWLEVAPWETALTKRFGMQAVHRRQKELEGKCNRRIILWGIEVGTRSGTFSLPSSNVERAREFLASPEFGPGHTRVQLKRLQELRGKMEHWAPRNSPIRHEMDGVGRLLAHYGQEAFPPGETPWS